MIIPVGLILRQPGWALAWLGVAISFTTLCFRLGAIPLISEEGRTAEIGREMLEAGEWLVPTYNGVDRLDKPAFYYRAVGSSLGAFGRTETAARLPSAAFAVGLAGMVFLFCRRIHGTRVAWLAVILVSTMPLFFANARIVILDMALTFFVCGAIFAGYLAEESDGRSRRNWYLLGAASAGFATLVKGPVGFALPLLVLLASHRSNEYAGFLKRLFSAGNVLVFLGITLPWFVALCVARPDFLHYGLYEETFSRFVSGKFRRNQPFYYYPMIIVPTFFPWSLLLPGAVLAAWKTRGSRWQGADRLCLWWCIVAIVLFSISRSKQPNYILSVTVACSILLARLIEVAAINPESRLRRVLMHATMAFALISGLGVLLAGYVASNPAALTAWLDLSPEQAVLVSPCAIRAAWILGFSAVLATVAWWHASAGLSLLSVSLFWPLLILVLMPAFAGLLEPRSDRKLAAALRRIPPDTELACYECFPKGLPFHLQRTMTLITRDGGELRSNYLLSHLTRVSSWPSNLVRLSSFDSWLSTRNQPVYLIADSAEEAKLSKIASARGASVDQLTGGFSGVLIGPGKVP